MLVLVMQGNHAVNDKPCNIDNHKGSNTGK